MFLFLVFKGVRSEKTCDTFSQVFFFFSFFYLFFLVSFPRSVCAFVTDNEFMALKGINLYNLRLNWEKLQMKPLKNHFRFLYVFKPFFLSVLLLLYIVFVCCLFCASFIFFKWNLITAFHFNVSSGGNAFCLLLTQSEKKRESKWKKASNYNDNISDSKQRHFTRGVSSPKTPMYLPPYLSSLPLYLLYTKQTNKTSQLVTH